MIILLLYIVCCLCFNDDPTKIWIYQSVPPPLDSKAVLVEYGPSGKYTETDQSASNDWKSLTFDDSLWSAVRLPFGYDYNNAAVDSLVKTHKNLEADSFHRFKFSLSPEKLDQVAMFGALLDVASDNAADVFINGMQFVDSTIALNYDSSGHEFEYANDHVAVAGDVFKAENIVAIKLFNNAGSSDAFLDFRISLNLEVLPPRSQWRYHNSTPSSSNWFQANVDDSSFLRSRLPIGFDDRVVDKFFNAEERVPKVYFRRTINITAVMVSRFSEFAVKLIFDAKASLWIDGQQRLDASMMSSQNATYFNSIVNVALSEGRYVLAVLIEAGQESMFFDCLVDGIVKVPTTTSTTPTAKLTTMTSTQVTSSTERLTLPSDPNDTAATPATKSATNSVANTSAIGNVAPSTVMALNATTKPAAAGGLSSTVLYIVIIVLVVLCIVLFIVAIIKVVRDGKLQREASSPLSSPMPVSYQSSLPQTNAAAITSFFGAAANSSATYSSVPRSPVNEMQQNPNHYRAVSLRSAGTAPSVEEKFDQGTLSSSGLLYTAMPSSMNANQPPPPAAYGLANLRAPDQEI